MSSPLGISLLGIFCLLLATLTALFGIRGPIGLVGLIVVVPTILYCFRNLEFGLLFTIACSFFINFLRKYSSVPFGTALDGLLLLLLVSLVLTQIQKGNFKFATTPMSIAVYCWVGYNILQIANPALPSLKGWAYSVRTLALWLILYFIAFHAFTSLKSILRYFVLLIALLTLSALYGLKQEYIGFSNQEMIWLHADPLRYQLYYTWSRLRIFSFFSDPTALGIAMGYGSVLCLILATHFRTKWRLILIFVAGLMLLTLAYTGSRTPVLIIVAGLFFYVLMTFKRETILIGVLVGLMGAGVMLKSTSNPVIYRLQSAFSQDDSSLQLRLRNQAFIQPYIQSHPFGAGLGSVGIWGQRFNANSWLSTFAPDSAYVRVAVETGWIGLIIFLALFSVALWTGIHYYFRVKDPTIKVLYLATTTIIFMLALANYPQEASYMLPTNLVFNTLLAVLIRLKDFDENYSVDFHNL